MGMVTMHMSERETVSKQLVATLRAIMMRQGRRFGQIIDSAGRVVKVVER
jgi:hypothetical protein